ADRIDASAPDVGEEGRGVKCQRQTSRKERGKVVAKKAQAIAGKKHHDEQRRRLNQLGIGGDYQADRLWAKASAKGQDEADRPAQNECDRRKRKCPAGPSQQEDKMIPAKFLDHAALPISTALLISAS